MTVIPSTATDFSGSRTLCGMVYESGRTQILMTGGKDINKSSILPNSAPIDTWSSTTGATWSSLSPTASPSHRYAHAMAYSSDDGYSFIHGGLDPIGVQFFGEPMWFYNGTTWAQFTGTFTPGTFAPTARFGHTMISADGYSKLIMFGGIGTTTLNHMETLSDTWTFSTTSKTWTSISSTNNPPARVYHGTGFDGYNAYVFGGQGNGNKLLGDMWKINALGLQWSSPTLTGTIPSARKGAAVCWDGFNNALTVIGGYTVNNGLSNETFQITSAGVSTLVSTAFHPMRKYGGTAVFNSSTNKIILFGGTLLDGTPDGSVFTFDCATKVWSGAGYFSSGAANGPVSDH